MTRRHPPALVLPVAAALAYASCSDASVPSALDEAHPPAALAAAAATLTASQGGVGGVFFLPPLMHSTYSGEFAADRMPEVVICSDTPAEPCASPAARFDTNRQPGQPASQVIRVVPNDEHFIVNWQPRREVQGVHRIFVVEAGTVLAFIDVIVVDHGTAVKDSRTGEVRVIRGALPVKFRMEGPPPPVHGLWGQYFDWRTSALSFDAAIPLVQRVDATIDFADHTNENDVFGIGQKDHILIRWTGFVEPEYSETYEFCVAADDGTRLWVNETLLIDDWVDHAVKENCSSVGLVAGVKHAIRLEWYENMGAAVVRLFWQSASRPKQIVPSAALHPF
jgi:hypothetical protein